MFNIGDVIIYSIHGLCQIDNICEKTFSDGTRTYYDLHPVGQSNLTISIPVDNDKVVMLKLLNREEAEEILQSFRLPGTSWIEDLRLRNKKYRITVKTGNRTEIALVINTLMRKKLELSMQNMKLPDQDLTLLNTIQTLLFTEIAHALDCSIEEIIKKVNNMVSENSTSPDDTYAAVSNTILKV
ncbi:CarD family transcriptional regulator [Paenisporosarcina indica]|uniref:CarD family transcriptional regulator n=1 Tax=Paenisporosarcina indica TaxID=650093 RepID=UPI00094FE9DD|nr:CarD family transcriptional regulator [Paenisporosarcina indica]